MFNSILPPRNEGKILQVVSRDQLSQHITNVCHTQSPRFYPWRNKISKMPFPLPKGGLCEVSAVVLDL